ncbi:MAG: LysM peptidoglycan-binding domain-containing protein [Planctomycetota bacterium]
MDRRTWWWWVGIVLSTGAATRGAARADITIPDPPRSKRVPVVETVDWGVFQDRVSRPYTVKAGDTLRSIAAAQCGDAARWKVLVEANPALAAAPDRIRTGDALWIPPPRAFAAVAPPAAGTADPKTALEPWYDAFTLKWVSRHQTGIADRTEPAPPARSRTGSFLLLPHADTAAIVAARASREVPWGDPLLARAVFVGFGHPNLVHTDEGTVRIEVTTRLTGRDGASVTRTQDVRRLDAAGKVVTKGVPVEEVDLLGRPLPLRPVPTPTSSPDETPPPAPPSSPPGAEPLVDAPADDGARWPAWLGLFVAGTGAAVLGGIAVVRRRRSPAA